MCATLDGQIVDRTAMYVPVHANAEPERSVPRGDGSANAPGCPPKACVASAEVADLLSVLVVARHPLRLDDLELDELSEVQAVELMRRPAALALAIEEFEPNVILVDTRFPENRGFAAIGQARALLPDLRILALTADPAPHDHVARATRVGASGFITADAEPREFADAVRTVHAGQPYLPSEETLAVLGSVAEDLDVTAAERRSRLTGIVIGLIPLTAAMAAIISLLWRKYVGDIGVRPVDLAIDPGSRVVDAFAFVSLVIGVFGPLLFVASWLNLLRAASEDQPRRAWLGSIARSVALPCPSAGLQ